MNRPPAKLLRTIPTVLASVGLGCVATWIFATGAATSTGEPGAASTTPSGAATTPSASTTTPNTAVGAVGGSGPVGQPTGKWSLKFDDEFTASSVTTVNAAAGLVKFGAGPTWKAWYPTDAVGDGNQHSNNPDTELEYYAISGISVNSGLLSLTARHDKGHDGLPYTSGMIQSNPSFNAQYGYAEACIKAPAVSGSWPAFWMISSTNEWPPEVDIFENFGEPGSYTVGNFGHGAAVLGDRINATTSSWHVYGLKWTSTSLEWYLDGRVVATESNTASVPREKMYLVLNTAVDGTGTTSFSTQVDYVRYWQ